MTIDIHLAKDRDELAAARAAVADALLACKGFSPDLADKAVDAVMAALFGHFAGGRVYYPASKGRSLPADLLAQIEQRLIRGEGCTAIARELKISRVTAYRVRKRMSENTALAGVLGDAS